MADKNDSNLPSTYRALLQTTYGQDFELKTLPTPQPGPGSAIVKIITANIISYMREIYNGSRKYPYPTPLIPGSSAIGRIAAVGPDATSLKPGQLVMMDITIRARDDATNIFLSAIHSGYTEGSKVLMQGEWRNGTYAEYAKFPLENLYPLDEARLLGKPEDGGLGYTVENLMSISKLAVSYGGLTDINLRPGETIIISPATGGFGGAAVQVALAMGAGRIIAMGRNVEALKKVAALDHSRIVTVPIVGNVEQEVAELKKYSPIDAFFDISPPSADKSTHFKAAILALRHSGRVSMMGGQGNDVSIPHSKIMHFNITLKGKWMYEREDVKSLIKLIERGILKVGGDVYGLAVRGTFGLEQWKEAFDLAHDSMGTGFVLLKP